MIPSNCWNLIKQFLFEETKQTNELEYNNQIEDSFEKEKRELKLRFTGISVTKGGETHSESDPDFKNY